uniref:Uncharacterized protein n=1 Tax=Ditylenchus dipsaci TaxID=166011 RepID=A0A915CUM5_9BILA
MLRLKNPFAAEKLSALVPYPDQRVQSQMCHRPCLLQLLLYRLFLAQVFLRCRLRIPLRCLLPSLRPNVSDAPPQKKSKKKKSQRDKKSKVARRKKKKHASKGSKTSEDKDGERKRSRILRKRRSTRAA